MPTTTLLGLPYPTPDNVPDGPAQIQALAEAIDVLGVAPAGSMFMWPGGAAPTGYLFCVGQTVLAAQYPKLALVLGSAGGNVTIPDMRDRFPVGAGSTMPNGSTGGVSAVTLAEVQLPYHEHGIQGKRSWDIGTDGRPGAVTAYTDGVTPTYDTAVPLIVSQGAQRTKVDWGCPADSNDTYNPVYDVGRPRGGSHENRPPFRGLNFIIKAG